MNQLLLNAGRIRRTGNILFGLRGLSTVKAIPLWDLD